MKKKYHHTDQTDEMIRTAYASPKYAQKRGGAIVSLSKRLGWPRHVVYTRAIKLGVVTPKKKPPPWSDEEIDLLEKHAHKTPQNVSLVFRRHGFSRSEAAISVKIKKELCGLKQSRVDAGILTGHQASALLGINDATLRRYIDKGVIPAERQGTARPESGLGDFYRIREKDLKNFIVNHTAVLNFARIDKYWLVDLLTGDSKYKAA